MPLDTLIYRCSFANAACRYEGMLIPKGAYIIPNVWWFLHDPEAYPRPEVFDPERFMAPRNEPDPSVSFGFGRRVCPGRYLADSNLFINIARVSYLSIVQAIYVHLAYNLRPWQLLISRNLWMSAVKKFRLR
ncbi:cytochrome P450 [Candidatus Bathyarchaeota archaeon]|nr:cytochrome P450 [Candidatus Bathyarchaeota archaeon]